MIFIALQNPGKHYEKTRHNAGAIALRAVEFKMAESFSKRDVTTFFKFLFSQPTRTWKNFYSTEYMNVSGNFVQKILKKEEAKPKELYLFFDDINIPVGKFIISRGVGASSHNGVKSVQQVLKSNDFYRVRIGVGKVSRDGKIEDVHGPDMDKAVLSNLSDPEIAIIESLALQILEKIVN